MVILSFLLDIIDSPGDLAKNKFQYFLMLIIGWPIACFAAAIYLCIVLGWYVSLFGTYFILESFMNGNGIIGGLIIIFNIVMVVRYFRRKSQEWIAIADRQTVSADVDPGVY